MATSISLADYLRSQIDNFTIQGDQVRIGGRTWRASRCGCGEAGCDGWQVLPARSSGSDDMTLGEGQA